MFQRWRAEEHPSNPHDKQRIACAQHTRRALENGRDRRQPFKRQERDTLKYPIKLKETETLLLNEADTNALRKVPGIGSAFARAIVNYRQRLGGFVKTEQLMEIDGFPEEALAYLKVENPHPRKLNINRLSLNELKRHPYINFFQAKAITDYRRLRGPIHSLQDLRLSKDFPPEAIQRLEPYVEYE
jgi:DNA uptake protein ComE-like DNA-binding protein